MGDAQNAITKQDLLDMETRLKTCVDERVQASESRLVEVMRAMQTEILRGFAAFSESHSIRLRKVEGDQKSLDAALSDRVRVVEDRLHEIELKLGGVH